MIEEAFAANLDLRVAIARIEEARAGLGVARSLYRRSMPMQTRTARDAAMPPTCHSGPLYTNLYGVGLQASYEVDLSGRVAAGVSAADSTLLATRYNTEAVRTVLAAQVATTYFTLLSLDAELQISRDTLVTRDDAVGLQRQRYDAGLISEYDLKLAQAERASVAASIPPLQRARAQTEAALATLAGRARAVFTPVIARGPVEAAIVPEVPVGLPSDVLARRPDIKQSEAQLASATARVAEARAQYFPSLLLTGFYGSESSDLSNLFSGPAVIWSIAGRLLQPIFTGGRISRRSMAPRRASSSSSCSTCRTCNRRFVTRTTRWSRIAAPRASFMRRVNGARCSHEPSHSELRYRGGGQLHRRAGYPAQPAGSRAAARTGAARARWRW